MTHRIIPAYDNYELIGRTRMDADVALANSNPLLLARGLVEGASIVHKFGANTSIPTTLSPVSTSLVYPTPVAATALEVVSDSTDDNGTTSPLGSGALTVDIHGITDWNSPQVIETVTLNGTTAVPMVNSFLRVYRLKIATSGTYASSTSPSHNSTLTLRESGAGATWAQITKRGSFGLGQSEIASFSVPAGQLCYMSHADVLVGTTKTVDVVFFARSNADTVVAPYSAMQSKIIMRNLIGKAEVAPETPYGPFIGPCDIGWMAASSVGTSSVEVDFELILFDD